MNAVTIQAVKELKAEKDAEIAALERSNAEIQQRHALVEGLWERLAKLEALTYVVTASVEETSRSGSGPSGRDASCVPRLASGSRLRWVPGPFG